MIISYTLRLGCLCFASFFLMHALLGLLALALAPAALRLGERMRPRDAARFLLALRLAPSALALLAVFGFCLPSYLWLEPHTADERVGLFFIAAALLGVSGWAVSFARSLRALFSSWRLRKSLGQAGHMQNIPEVPGSAFVVTGEAPILALAGVIRPHLIISLSVLRSLSPEQLEAAMRHEQSHRRSRDNLKRLALLLCPSVSPLAPRRATLDRAWARFSEWAADDDACAGDPVRSIALAEALVSVARLGVAARPTALMTCLVPEAGDLSARVHRLLNPQSQVPAAKSHKQFLAGCTAVLCGAVIVSVAAHSGTLFAVHHLLERLAH